MQGHLSSNGGLPETHNQLCQGAVRWRHGIGLFANDVSRVSCVGQSAVLSAVYEMGQGRPSTQLVLLVAYSMQHSPSGEANRFSPRQEIHRILYN
jgi:hypothetical protein